MRLQLADPADHPHLGLLPFATDLDDWDLPHMHGVLGLHRHVVRLVELGADGDRTSYVVKELPDHLALREYRLLRGLAEDRLPTASSSPPSPSAPAAATACSSPATSTTRCRTARCCRGAG